MKAREIAIASPSKSVEMGLPEVEHGVIYADGPSGPVTLVGDADFARFLESTPEAERADILIPAEKFPLQRTGW